MLKVGFQINADINHGIIDPIFSPAKKGTLVVAAPTEDGLVLVADQLTLITGSGVSQNAKTTKIYQVGDDAAFTVTGTTSFLMANLKDILFSVSDLTSRYFSEHPNADRTGSNLMPLGISILNQFVEAVNSHRFSLPPTFSFLIVVFQHSKHSTLIFITILDFTFDASRQTDHLSFKIVTDPLERHTRVRSFGNTTIFDELRKGDTSCHAKVLRPLRNQSHIKKFLFGPYDSKRAKSSDLISFSKYYIGKCHKLTLQLSLKLDQPIGNTVDVALISKNDGFRWQERDALVL